jgi:hypothetical protein
MKHPIKNHRKKMKMKKPFARDYCYQAYDEVQKCNTLRWKDADSKALYEAEKRKYDTTNLSIYLTADIIDGQMEIPTQLRSVSDGHATKYRIVEEDHEQKGDFHFSVSNENPVMQQESIRDFIEYIQNQHPAKTIHFLTIAIEAI